MLKSIGIKNYRSCVDTSLSLHPQLSVLIGPNGSGKTNILQAIMLLNKLAKEERSLRRRPEARTSLSSEISAQFKWDRQQAYLESSIDVQPDDSNRDVLLDSRQSWKLISRNGRSFSTDIPIALDVHEYDYYRYVRLRDGRSAASEQPKWATNLLRKVAQFCSGVQYYGASQFTNPSACPTSFSIERGSRRLSSLGFTGHKGMLRKIYLASKEEDSSNYQDFINIVGKEGLGLVDGLRFQEVEVSSTDYSVNVGGRLTEKKRQRVLVIPQFEIGKQVLSPNQLSEGTFKTLALLFHVITDTSSLLLIEEPEVCIHHGLLSSILELIKSSSYRKQIVISTHSDYVLDHVKPENVFRITRNRSKGTVARRLEDALSTREYAALRQYLSTSGNLGEYWREGGLGDRP